MELEDSSDLTDHLISRPYQAQLEEVALRNNTIIYLPTGAGKTFIAICLIKKFREALQKPWGEGGKRTFFLVNTVPLVIQQKKVIETLCAVKGVGAYSGEDGVDYWDKVKWDNELENHQVIVMTSQILCDMLTHQYIKIEDINLLIFDECHHGVEDHPMRIIMKHFEGCPKEDQPRVLGLTATLLNANVKTSKVEDTLHDLEVTFHATIATVNELGEVLNYSTNPNEMVQVYTALNPSEVAARVINRLTQLMHTVMEIKLPHVQGKHNIKLKEYQKDISTDPLKITKAVKNMVSSMITFINELGTYGGAVGILAYIILLERLKRKATTKEEELLFKTAISHCTESRSMLLHSMRNEEGYDKIVKHSSEQLLLMLNILKEYSPKVYKAPGVLLKVNKARKPLSAIIFTRQRFTAKVLFNILKDVKEANPEEFDFLKHDFIVGFNVNPLKSTREDSYIKKYSQQALLKFKNNDLNCLISTSVIEEGIDIPQCLLVLRYDPPQEYRSYIQSKGRARSAESSYVILINKSNEKRFMKNYNEFQSTEHLIQRILVGSSEDRNEPDSDVIKNQLYEEGDIAPFIAESGARLTATSSISLLNRYCMTLPSDKFTKISPMWIQEQGVDEKGRFFTQVAIVLPITCPIREEIKGLCLPNLKSAKRSAALNTCIKLYEAGALDSGLLPKRYTTVDFDETNVKEIFVNWREENIKDEVDEDGERTPLPGTRKQVRKHPIQFPKLLDSVPDSDTFFLHVIKMKADFEEPEDSREKALFKLLQMKECYGFLTQKPLPQICKFPMFMTVGEVGTSIEVNYAVIKLKDTLFELVKKYHYFLFDQVLGIAKKFLVFEGKVNCMYVVPLQEDNGYDIDWNLITDFKPIQPVQPTTFQERTELKVTPETHTNYVVTPWYRVLPDRYIVSKVLEYMSPESTFESYTDTTFRDYYADKYKLDVIGDRNQPLLEVKNISSRMNCLLPRAATINAFTDKQRKLVCASQGDDKNKGFTEIFVAEFCIKYDYPGVLWYKAIMLPSILHRVHMLLAAHELLAEIAKVTNYGSPQHEKNDEWLPTETDMQVVITSLLSQVEEPAQVNSIDRINNPIDEEKKRPKILSMRETLYQLQQKKLNLEYPWDEKIEPIDIDRNLSSVTVMDIECYDEFVSAPLNSPSKGSSRYVPPPRIITSAAISAPPVKYVDRIKVLELKPTKGPELRDMLAALTTIKSSDTFNLERAETLGDSFLKFAASLYLYHKFPSKNEGQLTNIKCRLISNRNLYYAGERFNLAGRMKVEQFSPRKDFLVPGFFAPIEVEEFLKEKQIRPTFLIGVQFPSSEALSGTLSQESMDLVIDRYVNDGAAETETEGRVQNAMQMYVHSQAVADKTVADCVEAIIGTYLLSGGILAAIKVIEWMKIIPAQDCFADLLHKSVPTVLSQKKATQKDINFLLSYSQEDVETILNYKFNDASFLLEALSHSSYIRNRLTGSYERLEFLGDAVLDFLITSHIFENCKDLKPGEITDLRSALVNNVTFASYVVKLGLHKFLCSELNPTLSKAIMMFVDHQEQRDHEIVEDVLYLIDEEECHIAEYVEVPKVLSDVFEALVGAMYLDSGGNLPQVWSVVYRIMSKEIHSFTSRIPQQPVRVLHERIHACPSFGEVVVVDPDIPRMKASVTITKNDRQYTVYGIGKNKSQAKRAAAKVALKLLSL
ncbi:endoribonuclease Dcr-2 [Anticarsia gemmatalis]|uniref:endoribonuclease Dcr-2 n=1 Tax=Anticarsia gemmatalis TaxID=129554 RepID=UPI003F76AA51